MQRWHKAPGIVLVLALGTALGVGPYLRGQAEKAPAVPRDLVSYRDVVKKVLPAVVSIQVTGKAAVAKAARGGDEGADDLPLPLPGNDPQLRKFFEEFRRRGGRMVPEAPDPRGHFGSGVIVDAGGVVVTNHHVVDGAGQVEVTLSDGRKFTSKDIVSDDRMDLAIVRLNNPSPLPFVELGDSDAMEIGDRVLALGAPYGLTGSVSAGIVSGKGRDLRTGMYEDYLQTDAAVNPGNSGGPLVNLAGQVIGINTAIKSQSGGFQGIGLAIPSQMVREVVPQLIKDGKVHRGYLGVGIEDLSPDVAAKLGLSGQKGVLLGKLYPNGPAAKAGLKEGDVLVAAAGQPVEDSKRLQRAVRTAPLGKPLAFEVLRDGQRQTVIVTIEELPGDFENQRADLPRRQQPRAKKAPEGVAIEALGIQVADLTADRAEQFGLKEGKGALITAVTEDSPAELAGLSRGMVITQAERQPVKSAAELKELVGKAKAADGVLLQVRTAQGGTRFVVVQAN